MSFAWQRVPNGHEVLTQNTVGSVVDFGIELWGVNQLLGDAVTAKTVIRDAQKLISTGALCYYGNEIGSTGLHYDSGYFLASVAKVGCKLLFIGGPYVLFPTAPTAEIASRLSNFPCEVLSRSLILASYDRQKNNATDTNFFQYVYENYNSHWLINAGVESLPKTLLSEGLASLIKKTGIQKILNNFDTSLHNHIPQYTGLDIAGANQIKNDGFNKLIAHFVRYWGGVGDRMAKFYTIGASLITDFTVKMMYESGMTYVMASVVRTGQDAMGLGLDVLKAHIGSLYTKKLDVNLGDIEPVCRIAEYLSGTYDMCCYVDDKL